MSRPLPARPLLATVLLLSAGALVSTGALAADPALDAAQGYSLEGRASPAEVKVGEAGKLSVVISPRAPTWHVHPQAPLKIRFETPAGLKVDRPELGRKDAVDAKAEAPRFESGFVAAAAGTQQALAHVDFFICSDTACVKQTKTLSIPVVVK